ncbi:hypothetical protein ACFYZB_42705 [Streptomyces sp. NPDC001852]|uniref:hypothetical protein n=1 Tax=Streptomyces sp. NPDC001852 TaxID=3364619 RepID=UPI0036BC7437
MNRTKRLGALIGTVAMSVGLGAASATPALAQSRITAASPVGKFFEPGAKLPGDLFKPGAKLIIKRNADYARSLSTMPAQPQGRVDLGEGCGTDVMGATDGPGPTTLVLSVSKERSVQLSGDAGISKSDISVSVGFSVTNTYKVANETRYEVPKGKHGNIRAYPLYEHYQVTIPWHRFTRTVDVLKPIGVCFNSWLD